MSQPIKRLTYAEAKRIEAMQGRLCRGCRTVYAPEQIPDSFGLDRRTRDGLTALCVTCIDRRDHATTSRLDSTHADAQARYRRTLRDLNLAQVQADLAALLPEHGIPALAFPGYPTPASNPPAKPRGPRQDAIVTRLYNQLRDAPFKTWEEVSQLTQRDLCIRLEKLGPRSFEIIDEHLKAFGLDPLAP
jgi:hypothetical protein